MSITIVEIVLMQLSLRRLYLLSIISYSLFREILLNIDVNVNFKNEKVINDFSVYENFNKNVLQITE